MCGKWNTYIGSLNIFTHILHKGFQGTHPPLYPLAQFKLLMAVARYPKALQYGTICVQ